MSWAGPSALAAAQRAKLAGGTRAAILTRAPRSGSPSAGASSVRANLQVREPPGWLGYSAVRLAGWIERGTDDSQQRMAGAAHGDGIRPAGDRQLHRRRRTQERG